MVLYILSGDLVQMALQLWVVLTPLGYMAQCPWDITHQHLASKQCPPVGPALKLPWPPAWCFPWHELGPWKVPLVFPMVGQLHAMVVVEHLAVELAAVAPPVAAGAFWVLAATGGLGGPGTLVVIAGFLPPTVLATYTTGLKP